MANSLEDYFPMTRSSFVTLGLVTFIGNYNNYIWPALILKDNTQKLITNGIADYFINSSLGRDWSHYGCKYNRNGAALNRIFNSTKMVLIWCY